MASSRRRFLATMGSVAGGAAALGTRGTAWTGVRTPVPQAPDGLAPSELLTRHAAGSSVSAVARPAAQTDPRMPSAEEVASWYTDRRNWGRWGDDDQKGAINLITPEKSAGAAGLVRSGRKVSASRVFEPEQHFMRKSPRPGGAGAVVDYYGFIYHGQTITHIDALCHMWDRDGMWQGRDPDVEVTTQGANFGTIDAWSEGIVTRGVLIDVPRHRDTPYVTPDRPVHGWEIEEIAEAQATIVGEALKSATIDIVGGETTFFDKIVDSIKAGKSVDRWVGNSDVLSDVKNTFFNGDAEYFQGRLRDFATQFGMSFDDVKDLSVAALIGRMITMADSEQDKTKLNDLLNVFRGAGVANQQVASLGLDKGLTKKAK